MLPLGLIGIMCTVRVIPNFISVYIAELEKSSKNGPRAATPFL